MSAKKQDAFRSNVVESPKVMTIELAGPLDESAKLPDVRPVSRVVINLKNVTMLNSIGTRVWMGWIQRFRGPSQVDLAECPVVMVKSFNIVKGFLPVQFNVLSFYIPFYSNATGERKDVLVSLGQHFTPGRPVEVPEQMDSKGNKMDLDVTPETYLAFLRR